MSSGSSTDHLPTVEADQIGWLTEADMMEVDRVMVEDLRIGLIQMMENAGRNLASLIVSRYRPETVTVLAGSGGNGGGGLVAARHLANHGVTVAVVLSRLPGALTGVPRHQLDILERMAVPIDDEPREASVVVDALIGYSLRGAPRGRAAELMHWLAAQSGSVVSLDTPSGLDVTTGDGPGAVVRADATLTLAMPKIGLRSAATVGELFVADISVPPSVYAPLQVGPPPPFHLGPIIRCRRERDRTGTGS
ncbi:MAG: NAD(P)H-hydrate epimerase [Actinomycetota bacterium]